MTDINLKVRHPRCVRIIMQNNSIYIYIYICIHIYIHTYRVFHDLRTLLQEVISEVFVIKKVNINMCPILDGYGVMGIFNSRTPPRVNRVSRNQLAGDVLNLAAYSLRCKH